MTLAFKTVTVPIGQTDGVFTSNQDVSFRKDVVDAEVAIKAFKLDYVGGARTSDVVQVGVTRQNVGEETVEFQVKANYSGGRYSGEVSVLIIAELRP